MSEEIIEEFDLSDEGEDEAKNFTPLATFGKGENTVPGSICGIVIGDTDSPYAKNGVAHIPAGQIYNIPNADTVGGLYGLVGKAEFKALQGKKPTFNNGDLNIPLAQAPVDSCNGTVDDDTPGGIVGIGYSEDGVFSIKDGYARIPRPATYEFDSDWFEVVDGQVRLKQEALASVVEELADEMSVEITGSGILEQTYAGTLKANTAGSLTLDTLVTY